MAYPLSTLGGLDPSGNDVEERLRPGMNRVRDSHLVHFDLDPQNSSFLSVSIPK